MSRLDEATAAALGEDFPDILPIGWCWCLMIHACELVRDYDRAAQWCRRLEEWSARMGVEFLNRSCRATYAGILVWRGTWDQAEQELMECAGRLALIRPLMVAHATVRLGELRRRQGRLEEAAEIFERTAEHPLALLGLAEVCLDQGDAAGARDRAEQYLREAPPHAVTLRSAGLELLPSATGDSERARIAFEDATRLFHRSGAPFEAARARIELARALAELSRETDAVREVRAAATSLRRIGAAAQASRADALKLEFQREPSRGDSPLTRRECEVLRLVADGNSDRSIAAQLVLSEHTVHRHLANILTKLDCASRSAAVAEAIRRGLI